MVSGLKNLRKIILRPQLQSCKCYLLLNLYKHCFIISHDFPFHLLPVPSKLGPLPPKKEVKCLLRSVVDILPSFAVITRGIPETPHSPTAWVTHSVIYERHKKEKKMFFSPLVSQYITDAAKAMRRPQNRGSFPANDGETSTPD